ncbi:MAG: tRNA-specific adenosine deaminase [endosymbiont of Galathealinum brachiosum]|uniref:tRNA-specific adenosine deaminase n=1 Tax=endosymbiont of Galathealinum brachiosum TaxID=2200906 RepID=A0A370DF39_9GAMM|nr:MAG: tRNA-specific adenosine deaminase [endosymbiont of Galathealinum brachiosum]
MDFLQQAIDLAIQSAKNTGGPFGAVVVKNGHVIGKGHNQVTENCDPSAHAEIIAIREACKNVNNHQLNDCIIYSSCEPCPMCMSAIYWARIPELVYAATAKDAQKAGFDDQFIYDELSKPYAQRRISIKHSKHDDANKSFEEWLSNNSREEY